MQRAFGNREQGWAVGAGATREGCGTQGHQLVQRREAGPCEDWGHLTGAP